MHKRLKHNLSLHTKQVLILYLNKTTIEYLFVELLII